jgi:hypothetical protein
LGAEHVPPSYEDLVSQVVDYAIIALDPQGTIQTWNLGAERVMGRGIDPRDIGTILEEFARGRLADADGGTGLGLASVRDRVDRQHGTVSIDSEVGVGTTVTVDLPSPHSLRPAAPSQRSRLSAAVVVPVDYVEPDEVLGAASASSPTGQSPG